MSRFFATVLVLAVTTDVAHAQSRRDCSTPDPPGVGVSFGRSSPNLDLSRGVVDPGLNGSVLVYGGNQLAGRVELPIAGRWRARVEGSFASWRVVRKTYSDSFQLIAQDTVGHVEARQIVAMVGGQGGRSPACGYVLAGGGIFSLDYQGASLRRPGWAVAAGIEVLAGHRGAVQAEIQLHAIDTRARYPIADSTLLAASISVGWMRRF